MSSYTESVIPYVETQKAIYVPPSIDAHTGVMVLPQIHFPHLASTYSYDVQESVSFNIGRPITIDRRMETKKEGNRRTIGTAKIQFPPNHEHRVLMNAHLRLLHSNLQLEYVPYQGMLTLQGCVSGPGDQGKLVIAAQENEVFVQGIGRSYKLPPHYLTKLLTIEYPYDVRAIVQDDNVCIVINYQHAAGAIDQLTVRFPTHIPSSQWLRLVEELLENHVRGLISHTKSYLRNCPSDVQGARYIQRETCPVICNNFMQRFSRTFGITANSFPPTN